MDDKEEKEIYKKLDKIFTKIDECFYFPDKKIKKTRVGQSCSGEDLYNLIMEAEALVKKLPLVENWRKRRKK